MKKALTRYLLFPILLLTGGCTGIPDGITPADHFELQRYMGKWYEAARLDNHFEKGLTRTSAEYGLRDDGSVRVLNKGWNAAKNRWQSAEGRARFATASEDIGYLKVSFFGPFYGSYVIAELDHKDYQYALVCGKSRNYLWILTRTPAPDPAIVDKLIKRAAELGFDTQKLIFPQKAGSNP